MLSTSSLTGNHHIVHLRYIRLIFRSLYLKIQIVEGKSTKIPGKGMVTWLERRKSIDGKLRPSAPKVRAESTESTMLFLGVDHPYLDQHTFILDSRTPNDPDCKKESILKMIQAFVDMVKL